MKQNTHSVKLLLLVAVIVVFQFLLISADEAPEETPEVNATVTTKVYMDINIGNESAGRIVIGLFENDVPKTAENFRQLITGENGFGYNGSIFHRIIPGFVIHGGDITMSNGYGGKSIYGDRFPDENFNVKHSTGSVGMPNSGKDTNGSQFYITLEETPWLDGKHVVFGKVVEGMEVVTAINELDRYNSNRPKTNVTIVDCGELASE